MKWHKSFPQMKNIENNMNDTKETKKPMSNSRRAMVLFVGFGMLLVIFAVVVLGAK